jgi:PIN domain nuclease of toxin-antitoxin system
LVLLDTSALLWWAFNSPKLTPRARQSIQREHRVWVSAATAWEIATKVHIGKLPGAEELAHDIPSYVLSQGFEHLPFTLEHAQRAGSLPGPHRDPFDRMLIAQCQDENLKIISGDEVFDRYGILRIW